jgi:uncharacterized damage-inducible protein DinB
MAELSTSTSKTVPDGDHSSGVGFRHVGITHLRYHRWATDRVLEETVVLPAGQLVTDFKSSFGSIYETLVHLYQSDAIWLARLEGRPTGTRADYEAPGCTYELRDIWSGVLDKMTSWAESLSESGWSIERSYKTLAGLAYATPLWQMVLHIVNHGSHHRGQITTMLRQLGVKPVNLDLIAYYRAHSH